MGSGQFYRRWILMKYGLRAGMKLLDVATGTGLVARAATSILREPGAVVGLDPSIGMLRQAQRTLAMPLVQGTVEDLPFATDHFDFLSMGYALRHMADLGVAFRQCLRVLKPGGRIMILEITAPRSGVGRYMLRVYFETVLPRVMRLHTASAEAELLLRYYWDTIAQCVPPDVILESPEIERLRRGPAPRPRRTPQRVRRLEGPIARGGPRYGPPHPPRFAPRRSRGAPRACVRDIHE